MAKNDYAETIAYLESQKKKEVNIKDNLGSLVPGLYRYYDGKWHRIVDGISYPITYVKKLDEE